MRRRSITDEHVDFKIILTFYESRNTTKMEILFGKTNSFCLLLILLNAYLGLAFEEGTVDLSAFDASK